MHLSPLVRQQWNFNWFVDTFGTKKSESEKSIHKLAQQAPYTATLAAYCPAGTSVPAPSLRNAWHMPDPTLSRVSASVV